ncbi:hypothetical protein V1498_09050 [Peribacillus sp. SCS-26]|uniref:hypothetical protein n=1 Tax=Paraperibacillus marinus TaxID=3115295 RepID=UPI003906180F
MKYKCTRLGFDTMPRYQFNCWKPKEQVVRLIKKEQSRNVLPVSELSEGNNDSEKGHTNG